MRRWLRNLAPDHRSIADNRWLAPFRGTLLHPRLWHLNRHSAAGGVALGLFCGLIPGPLQMISAAFGAVLLRVNLPLALLATLYTNPFTIVPLYLAAFKLGAWVLQVDGSFVAPPEWGTLNWHAWMHAVFDWGLTLGRPLAFGLLLLALALAASGYLLMRMAWRWHLLAAWRRRCQIRSARRRTSA